MDEGYETRNVSRVENYNDKFDLRAIFLDIVSEFLSCLGVACEKILTGHALFARCSAGRDDVLSILECNGRICSGKDVGIIESALAHFFSDALC